MWLRIQLATDRVIHVALCYFPPRGSHFADHTETRREPTTVEETPEEEDDESMIEEEEGPQSQSPFSVLSEDILHYAALGEILLVGDFNARTQSRQCEIYDFEDPTILHTIAAEEWFALKRDHAAVVAFDTDVFPLFQQHCKRRPLPEFWRQQSMYGDPSKQHNCIPDEHYVQTLLAIRGYEDEIERRTLTFTQWDQSGKNRERKGWHPVTFALSDASSELINSIKNITSVYYETEYRREWCSSNGTARPCFLFARKFTRGATLKLLNETFKS
ncbi:hypothetical protein L7F22_045225 [Adiantum nelumboides]|nr:hypothetical protein [Adiantum nelumboides]